MIGPPPRPTLFPYTPLSRPPAIEADLTDLRPRLLDEFQVIRVAILRPVSDQAGEPGARPEVPVEEGVGLQPNLRREVVARSEEHTSELQSLRHLVCRLLPGK